MKNHSSLLIVLLLIIAIIAVSRSLIIDNIYQLDADFKYSAQMVSVDNLYDADKNRFTDEITTESKFTYKTIKTYDDIHLIKNEFEVRNPFTDEDIFTVVRIYGIDSKTTRHVYDYGDKERHGYLFGPRHNKKENFTYWHVNYDAPALMEFKREEIINGLNTYRYDCYYTADQTENLTSLENVPEKYGVNLSIYLQLWLDPETGWLIKYEDHTTGWFYDINTKERVRPWNEFRNRYTMESIVGQANYVKNLHSKLFLLQTAFPSLSLFILVVLLLVIFLKKKFEFKKLRPAYFASIILCIGFSLSYFAYHDVKKNKTDREWRSFDSNYKKLNEALQIELNRNKDALEFLRLETQVYGIPNRQHFKEISNYWLKSLTDVQAIEWVPEVDFDDKIFYEQKARKDGFEDFIFSERDTTGRPIPVKKRHKYYPVFYAEPLSENEPALGFDLGSNQARLKALMMARLKGEIYSSEPITLVQEKKSQKSIIVFNPVWQNNTKTFLGYFVIVLRMGDFLEAMTVRYGFADQMGIKIFDITKDSKTLLYSNLSNAHDIKESSASRSFGFLDRIWEIEFISYPKSTEWEFILLFLLGCFVTIISAVFGYRILSDNKKELIELNKELKTNQNLLKDKADQLSITNNELKNALEEIKNKQKDLIEVENLKTSQELAAAVSHEFGQPLQALSSTVGILKGGGDVHKLIPHFDEMIKRFVELTDNLRNITSLPKKEYLNEKILDLDASSPSRNGSNKILIVDDEELVLQLLVEMFNTKGIKCDGASSGQQGLEMIKSNDYKAIISDVSMPEMSGPQFFKKVKALGNRATFIFITGYEMSEDLEKVVAQADGIINKPVSFEALFELLQRLEITTTAGLKL